jgi:tetratricopeptide (TPR) repeat protein
VVDAALAWLQGVQRPFFLWVHVYDPHVPYAPPAEFRQKAGGDAYNGEIAYADAQIGRLLEALAKREDASDTVVAVTGDHGEGLGEHGEQTHGMLAYDTTLRVPMMVGDADRSSHHLVSVTSSEPLSLLDLHWMLLDRARVREARDGVAPLYSETRYPRRAGWHALSVLADDKWKLILSSEPELYDVHGDPGEQHNVAHANPNVVQAMSAALAKMTATQKADAPVSADAAARLRALGYVSGSSPIISDDPKAPNPAREIAAWTSFESALGELASGRATAALPALKALAGKYPNAPVFQTTYAQALKETGRAAEAMAIYKAAAAKWTTDAALFHDLAVAAREAGNVDEATRAEQAALALDASSAPALNGLGLLHADAGRTAEAAAAFEKAVKIDASNASYWTNLGNARRGLDDSRGAEEAYRQALALDATFPDALNGLGTLLVQSRRSAEAVPMFEQALQRDPTLFEARLNLGIAYQEIGQVGKAAAAYRDVLGKAPATARREREAALELLRQLR